MSLECPQCKSPVARDGQRFCYRCGHDLSSYYDSLSIKLKDIAPEPVGTATNVKPGGATEVLASDTTIVIDTPAAKDQSATLRILLPTGDVFDREVTATEIQLGKGPRNDIVIADPAVSTAHAALKCDGGQYTIADLGSRNGTFVNGERIAEPHKLAHGDVIGMGLSKLTFRLGGYSETGAIRVNDVPPSSKPAAPPLTVDSLAAAVISSGLAGSADVERLRGSGGIARRLGLALVEDGLVSPPAMADLIGRTFQIPRIDLRSAPIDEEIAINFSSKTARDHRVFAFGKKGGVLLLAMADPTDTGAVGAIEREMSTSVAVHVAALDEITEQLEKYYGPKLIGVLPSGEKLRFLITQGEVEIGKASHNQIVLTDPTVSNTHAVLMARDGGYTIVDLGSRNGTFVNGEKLEAQPRTLRHGDAIQLGQTVLTFRNSGETPENITATLTPAALEEVRRRAAAMAGPDSAAAADTAPSLDAAKSEEEKKKKKKKKKDSNERMRAAYVSGLSRIVAQVLGVVLAVALALYVNSMRSGSNQPQPVVETGSKGKAKIKVAKAGDGYEFTGGFFEASGVVQGPSSDGVYFIDDGTPNAILFMPIDQTGRQAGDIKHISLGMEVLDPEAITYGGSFIYVVGSQSRRDDPQRNSMVRFALDEATQSVKGHVETVVDLHRFLFDKVPELAAYRDVRGDEGGLNIEGISWDSTNDRLLLGLRSPVIDGRALVIPLKLSDPRGAFSTENLTAGAILRIPLGGLGIRDIEYDTRAGAFLVIAGAPTHGEAPNFALWEWNGDDNPVANESIHELTKLDGRMKPEGIARVRVGGREFLLVVGDGSRYLKLDVVAE
jgi:pSer/pThr/pTyr-binding forkhead associated (FHA) protein